MGNMYLMIVVQHVQNTSASRPSNRWAHAPVRDSEARRSHRILRRAVRVVQLKRIVLQQQICASSILLSAQSRDICRACSAQNPHSRVSQSKGITLNAELRHIMQDRTRATISKRALP